MFRMALTLTWAASLAAAAAFGSAAGTVDNELTEQEKADGWKLLFNGKDLTGWGCLDPKRPTSVMVENGAIVRKKKEPDLAYVAEQFENFHLSVDWKSTCNSGVFVRAQKGNREMPGPPPALEVQIAEPSSKDAERRAKISNDVGARYVTGALYSLAAPSGDAYKSLKIGDWNNFYVICEGPVISCKINGIDAWQVDFREEKYRDPQGSFKLVFASWPRKGFVVLQEDHGGDKDLLEFKNIKMKVLPDEKK